jgi:hypothetical protein
MEDGFHRNGKSVCVCVCVFVMVIGGRRGARFGFGKRVDRKNRAKPHLAISSASEAPCFDTVLKHGWLSAPCLAAKKKKVYNHSNI